VSRLVKVSSWSLAGRLFAMQVGIVGILVAAGFLGAYIHASNTNEDDAEQRVLAVANSVAAAPLVRESLALADPSSVLQPYADQVRRDTSTDFVVIMTPSGTRLTHPNPELIGGRFRGHIEAAVAGNDYTETYTGTLGPSVRAVVPVVDGGNVEALVSVGITTKIVSRSLQQQIPVLIGGAALALLLAGIGSWFMSRWLRRTTHNLGPAELSHMYEFYDAVLHAVREGLLLIDRSRRVQLANDEAFRLLDLPTDAVGRRIDQLGLPYGLGEDLAAGEERADELRLTNDRMLIVNQARARWAGKYLGTVVTLRDQTELRALIGELASIRELSEALRSQAHEAANQLHTVVSLIELGRADEAAAFATAELTAAQELTDLVVSSVDEPVVAALLLGKVATAHERGVELWIAADTQVPANVFDPRDLVKIVGNLIDNAIDAAAEAPPPRQITVHAEVTSGDQQHFILQVADSGPGLDTDDVARAFQRGWSTKTDERLHGRGLGLALVARAVHRYGGNINVAKDRGAVFTVDLPFPRVGTVQSLTDDAGRPPPGGPSAQPRVPVAPAVTGP
jgi:two-component system, CitB family, sensor kinase